MAETKVPSLSQRQEEAGMPKHVDREYVASLGEVTWLSATAAQARNPQTGEMGDGMLVSIEKDGHVYTTFIGNVALLRVLGAVEFPFRARIVKSGNAWVFAD